MRPCDRQAWIGCTHKHIDRLSIMEPPAHSPMVSTVAASPHYKGLITGLPFDPVPSGRKGDFIKLKSISLRERR